MRHSSHVLILLGLLLVAILGSCGTQNVGVLDPTGLNQDHQVTGVRLGGFEVVRLNADGNADDALNSTLALNIEQRGGESALLIDVNDTDFTTTVALEVKYDSNKIHPVRAEFHDLLGDNSQALNAAFLNVPGKAAIGETVIGSYRPSTLSGSFATVYFADGALRNTSAIGDAHKNPSGVDDVIEGLDNFVVTSDVPTTTVTATWYGGWHRADGDQNKEVNVADMTPIGAYFGDITSENWAAVRADYDHNTEVNLADLTPIGVYYGQTTDNYAVEASDDVDLSPRTLLSTVAWADGDAFDPNGAIDGELYPLYTRWSLTIDAASTFPYSALLALDTNANNKVRIFVTPHEDTGTPEDGVESFKDADVGSPIPIPDNLTITDFDIQITGVTGGAGAGSDLFGPDANDMGAVANSAISMQLNSISGTFNAQPFDAATLPEGMVQADYDTALAAARDNMFWSIDHAGAAGFRRTTDWLTLDTGSFPMSGDPGSGIIFPDDDPESDATNPEGELTVRLPSDGEVTYPADQNLEVHVLSAVSYTIGADTLVDENAAVITQYLADPDNPLTELVMNQNTTVMMPFDWGTDTPPEESDWRFTLLQMWRIDEATGVAVGPPVDFEYLTGELQAGKFNIIKLPDPDNRLIIACVVSGVTLQQGAFYAFRFSWSPEASPLWSSINKPAELLTTADPPPPQDLIIVPDRAFPAIDQIILMFDDPVIRRNPRLYLDIINNELKAYDQDAFDDILKINGLEFAIIRDVDTTYPIAAVKETGDPNLIISPDDPDNEAGIIVVEANPHRVLLDVAVTTTSGSVGDPDRTFSVKLFGPGNAAVGQGVYNVAPIQIDPPAPQGIRWGINVWNREEMEIADRIPAYDTFLVDGTTIATGFPTPDVFWVEFGGGWIYDFTESPDQLDLTSNVKVLLTDNGNANQDFMPMLLRIVGIDAAGNYIAVHPIEAKDFVNPVIPGGGPGKLNPGHDYTVQLEDEHYPGIDWTFADHDLVVVGTNPNL